MNTVPPNYFLKGFRTIWKGILCINNKNIRNKHIPDTGRNEESTSSIPGCSLIGSCGLLYCLPGLTLGISFASRVKVIPGQIIFLYFNGHTPDFLLMAPCTLCTSDLKYMSITSIFSFILFIFSFALIVSFRSWLCKHTGKWEFCGSTLKTWDLYLLGSTFVGCPHSFWRWSDKHELYQNFWLVPNKNSTISPSSCGFIDRIGDNITDILTEFVLYGCY